MRQSLGLASRRKGSRQQLALAGSNLLFCWSQSGSFLLDPRIRGRYGENIVESWNIWWSYGYFMEIHGYLVDTSWNHSVLAHDDSHRRFLQWWIYPMAVSENGVCTGMATFSHIFMRKSMIMDLEAHYFQIKPQWTNRSKWKSTEWP